MIYQLRVLDIGARYGLHPSWKDLKTKAEFILVDADPYEVDRLKKKYKGKDGFIIINSAISDKVGFLKINILNNPAMSGSKKRIETTPLFKDLNRKSQIEINNTVQVEMSSISSICEKYGKIDFLKLDIEGGEMSALKSNNDFSSILGIRSEVTFSNIYENDKNSSFPEIHSFLEDKGYILLNLDYEGKGDPWSNFVADNKRYGSLVSTDAVWIKEPNSFVEVATIIDLLKMVIFLFLNNGSDLAIWILGKRKNDIYNSKNNKLKEYAAQLLVKHFYSIKWSPAQSIKEHQKFFNEVFDFHYPEMNKYNESEIYNPN